MFTVRHVHNQNSISHTTVYGLAYVYKIMFPGGLLYWSDNVTVSTRDSSQYLIWHPPRIQAMPIDILVTSYAILTYAVQNRLAEALPAVRWLTAQRNSLGGFASSQVVTVMCLW